MTNFWNKLPKPFFVLAPMEAVTDVVFRHIVASARKPDIFFTEFVNASSFCNQNGIDSTCSRLTFTDDEQPIVVQIWGNKPDEFETMSIALANMRFAGIDINMGCPDKSVNKTGSGSALIKSPTLVSELISATKAGGLPISVKTRLDDTSIDEWPLWIEHLLKQNISNLTIHLRTRKEMSKINAHYELIPEIKKIRDKIAPQTLLTINGDVINRQHGEKLAKQYNIDGVMIGRGIFSNPFAFEITKKEHTREELIKLLYLHLDLYDKYSNESFLQGLQGGTLQQSRPRKFNTLKRFFKVYIHGFSGANELRVRLMDSKNTDEAREIISNYLTGLT